MAARRVGQRGAEAVGGVMVVRYGFNPLEAIKNVKGKIREIAPGLPVKAVLNWDRVTPPRPGASPAGRASKGSPAQS